MENMEPIDIAPAAAKDGAVVGDQHPGGREREVVKPPPLTAKELNAAGLLRTSDAEGIMQLLFHLACLALCAAAVGQCRSRGWWLLLVLVQIPFGVCESFLFNGYHEMVHNTAFRTPWLNTVLAEIIGFFIFRGAKWFWCFHWTHHRYTNDPKKDPELSGESVDLDDPTVSLSAYCAFISGYPFGFERVPRMFGIATGSAAPDPWVASKPDGVQQHVRLEAAIYCLGYFALALCALRWPFRVGEPLVLYWLLPHAMGAGHLRLYQFAEHRACRMGPYTDTSAWTCSRTTYTWWLYRKLAWQMPWHVEHHAWPNVPFHKLEQVHQMVKAAYKAQGLDAVPTGCNPEGGMGYLGIQRQMVDRMLRNMGAPAKAA